MGKIIRSREFAKLRDGFRKQNKTVVLCHGVFDLLHYGHIVHFHEAKDIGDILVVSVTAARFVNKGPERPFFDDQQRLAFLSSIEYIDYVLLSEAVTAHEVVKAVQPDIYVKGQEYATAENDVTGNIVTEQQIVEQYGGRIYFTQGEVYSSTKLLNNFFGALPEDVVKTSRGLRKKYGEEIADKVREMIESFSHLRVLVIGDIIIDDYVFCNVQGLTTKDAAISARYDFQERYAGGALAIAKHLANFADDVALLSMMGKETDIASYIAEEMPPVECYIIQNKNFVTPLKTRYLKRHPLREEYEKLFSVNCLLDADGGQKINYSRFYRTLDEMIPNYDVVVVCDYGHGLLDEIGIRKIEAQAKMLAVNCQTNSSNYGMNVITKYKRADVFVVDEKELRLPFGQTPENHSELLEKLEGKLASKYGWVTMGAHGALGRCEGEAARIPAVTLHVKDTVGAGDAFYSLATLSAVAGVPIDIATLVANVAGAIKANRVGNSKSVGKMELLKFLHTVLNV